jgi:hypothetical protein
MVVIFIVKMDMLWINMDVIYVNAKLLRRLIPLRTANYSVLMVFKRMKTRGSLSANVYCLERTCHVLAYKTVASSVFMALDKTNKAV